MTESESDSEVAVVLDFLPHGRAEDERPQYQKPPLGYALTVSEFELLELTFDADASAGIGDRVVVDPPSERDDIEKVHHIEYEDLSGNAQSELEHAVKDIVDSNQERFVDFYNDAQPITLRLHQLNLLPGIGKKLRNNILEQRKRQPFDSFDDLEERVAGLHDPEGVLVERIIEEVREDDLKYRTFARRE
jgi:putative nucleotide binding protein